MPAFSDEKHIPRRCGPDEQHRRCQAPAKTEHGGDDPMRCPFMVVPGTKYCVIHSVQSVDGSNKTDLYNFRVTEVSRRIAEYRDHPDSRKLTVELGLLRLILEETINKCKDAYDLVTNNTQLTSLIERIRVVQQANIGIEQKLNDLLTIEQVTEIAQKLFNVIVVHVTDLDLLETIASEFENILTDGPTNTSGD